MIDVGRAAARFETVTEGIATRHCFSSGGHYDPANIAFGSLVALDEHVVAPRSGFDRHSHRGVDIVSWVLAGTLRHEDSAGRVELVRPGTALLQSAGSGIEHIERNASDTEALRFVQLTLLATVSTPGSVLDTPPIALADGEFDALTPVAPIEVAAARYVHLFVARGTVCFADHVLTTGDSARVRDTSVTVEGAGEVLVWRSSAPGAG